MVPSDVEERLDPGPLAEAIANLAALKARAVATGRADGLILGADTMVVIDGDAFGKPADRAGAVAMLQRLRGRVHDVLTGVAVVDVASGRTFTATETTRVIMARYPDELVDRYVASGASLDKAGGYAIQDLDGALVEGIAGSYTNVVGLPLRLTARLLVSAGATVSDPAWS